MPCSLEHCKGLQREHALLAVFLVLKAGALISYVTRQRRLAARSAASVCVLPVYSRLLQYEALHSCLWAATFGLQAYVDGAGARDAVQTALLTTQYLTAASWVLCSEGLLLFLAGRGAGLAALRLATRAAAAWAILLTAGCGCALLAWAIRVPQPTSQPLQLLFAAAWAPYWSRLCVNIVAYPAAAAALGILRPKPAWERGALPLCAFNSLQARSTHWLARPTAPGPPHCARPSSLPITPGPPVCRERIGLPVGRSLPAAQAVLRCGVRVAAGRRRDADQLRRARPVAGRDPAARLGLLLTPTLTLTLTRTLGLDPAARLGLLGPLRLRRLRRRRRGREGAQSASARGAGDGRGAGCGWAARAPPTALRRRRA